MSFRPLIAVSALAIVALSGCGLLPPAPAQSNSQSESTETPTPTATKAPVAELPEDALLSISMRATTDTGAAVDILLVLRKALPFDSPAAAPRVAATVKWCVDEVDQSVVQTYNYSFAQLDATATQVPGTQPWPSDLALHLAPGEQTGPSIAEGGDVYPVERPNELNEEAFYVPHCQQDGFLTVPGKGELYLGFQDDADSLNAWIGANYGATFDLWGEPTDPGHVTLSDCKATITPLGKSQGASESNMTEFFSDTQCFLVGSQV